MKKKFLLSIALASLLNANNAMSEGDALGNSLKSYFSNNQESAFNSLQGGKMQTVDGSKSADVRLSCEEVKSGDFLKVSYTGTSDINVNIAIDKNVDGRIDQNYVFDGVSGICSNGLVKCDKNSWRNCEYYQYSYGNSLSLVKTSINNMSACYCINSSCGSLAQKNQAKILEDIASPIYSALSSKSQLVLSKAGIQGNSIIYKGDDFASCNLNGSSPVVSSDSNLEALAQAQARKDLNNSNSVYSIFYAGTDNNISLDDSFKNKLSSDYLDVGDSVRSNISGNNLNFSYTDSSTGKKVNASVQISNKKDITFCEVRVAYTDTSAFSDETNRHNSTNNTTMYKGEIRECVNNACPVKSGELVKHNCGNISDMGEILGQLSAIDEASKDMVCSK